VIAFSQNRILVLDGAMFTLRAQRRISAADAHHAYLEAGADIISTDTFGALNAEASAQGARAARTIADAWTRQTPAQPRLVAGVMSAAGPEPSLRALLAAQMQGLIAGGVDLLLAETLASFAEVAAVFDVVSDAVTESGGDRVPPLMISVAVTPAGVLPSGETIEGLVTMLAAELALARTPLLYAGLNCGSGTANLRRPLETLARLPSCRVSCHPSAGSPDAFGEFDESPDETARFLEDAARQGLLDLAGGCCGTTPEHIEAIAAAVRNLPARMGEF
jgi:5-methyltetrahydrofolate--homocysteine methyltransferase